MYNMAAAAATKTIEAGWQADYQASSEQVIHAAVAAMAREQSPSLSFIGKKNYEQRICRQTKALLFRSNLL